MDVLLIWLVKVTTAIRQDGSVENLLDAGAKKRFAPATNYSAVEPTTFINLLITSQAAKEISVQDSDGNVLYLRRLL